MRASRCRECGYDLSGLEGRGSDRCPECGSRPECRCAKCGCDLSQMPRSSTRCPECAAKYDPGNPSGLKPWPHPLVVLAEVCGPFWVVLVPSAVFGSSSWKPVTWMLMGALMIILAYLPAQGLAERHATYEERQSATIRMCFHGLGINLLIAIGVLIWIAVR